MQNSFGDAKSNVARYNTNERDKEMARHVENRSNGKTYLPQHKIRIMIS